MKREKFFKIFTIIIFALAIIVFLVFIFVQFKQKYDIKDLIGLIVTIVIALATGGTYLIIFYFHKDFNIKFPAPPGGYSKSNKKLPNSPYNPPSLKLQLEINLENIKNVNVIDFIEDEGIEDRFYFQNLSDDLEIIALEEKLIWEEKYIVNRREKIIKLNKIIEKEQFFSFPKEFKILYFRLSLKDCFSGIVEETTNNVIIEQIGYDYLKNLINL